MEALHMNKYLRYTEIYLSCVVFGMCCQRGRVYYLEEEITEKVGEFSIIEGDSCSLWCKIQEGEKFY